jgi:hypothetical protein
VPLAIPSVGFESSEEAREEVGEERNVCVDLDDDFRLSGDGRERSREGDDVPSFTSPVLDHSVREGGRGRDDPDPRVLAGEGCGNRRRLVHRAVVDDHPLGGRDRLGQHARRQPRQVLSLVTRRRHDRVRQAPHLAVKGSR